MGKGLTIEIHGPSNNAKVFYNDKPLEGILSIDISLKGGGLVTVNMEVIAEIISVLDIPPENIYVTQKGEYD